MSVQDMKDVTFDIVRASGASGLRPVDVHRRLAVQFDGFTIPCLRTVERWLKKDSRYWKPTGYGLYAVRLGYRYQHTAEAPRG